MKELWFVLGGARSGKSTYALELARKLGGRTLFVATATPSDEFMQERISNHRKERPQGWQTLESDRNVGAAISKIADQFDVIIIDCLTVLSGNRVIELPEPVSESQAWEKIKPEIDGIIESWNSSKASFIIVSNEVGLGVVPATNLGCAYRDALGRANRQIAEVATNVVFMVSGLPMNLKGK
jgi:adenosylcobinamide kinase / adenosylcobinamide-phosphate guanylyltransferase